MLRTESLNHLTGIACGHAPRDVHRVADELRAESTIQSGRTFTINAGERFTERAILFGREAAPHGNEARVTVFRGEPFYVCRSGEIGERAGLETAGEIELLIPRQISFERPLRRIAARHAACGRPVPVMRPSTNVA